MGRRPTNENAFAKLLREEQGPLYWVDPTRVIRFINEPLARLLGVERDQIEGRKAEYHSSPTGDENHDRANQLCPPAEAFTGRAERFSLRLVNVRGEATLHRARSSRLRSPAGEELGLLVLFDGASEVKPAPLGDAEELHARVAALRAEHRACYSIDRYLGVSEAAQRLREQIAKASESNACATIVGPPGSGRETTARTIHTAGNSPQRLLPISCRQLDAELLRSMIDSSVYRNKVEATDAPVLLLLDVDQLEDAAQATLRRVFDEPYPPRILSTARRRLRELADANRYDRALAERLGAIEIVSPPLSERREDIPILAQAFLEQLNIGAERQLTGFAECALDLLVCYSWPENIDQLFEVVRSAAAIADGPLIHAAQLPERVRAARHAAKHPREIETEPINLDAILEQVERELIERALTLANGNKSKAAQLLSLPRARLLRRLEQLQIGPPPKPREEKEELPDFRPLSEFPELSAALEEAETPPFIPAPEGEAS